MTPDELNTALDAMEATAGDDVGKRPGLIEIQSDAWIHALADMQTVKPKTIVDGPRIRDIKIAISAATPTRILTRDEAGERGEPYRP